VPHIAGVDFPLTPEYTIPKGTIVFPSLLESSFQVRLKIRMKILLQTLLCHKVHPVSSNPFIILRSNAIGFYFLLLARLI